MIRKIEKMVGVLNIKCMNNTRIRILNLKIKYIYFTRFQEYMRDVYVKCIVIILTWPGQSQCDGRQYCVKFCHNTMTL